MKPICILLALFVSVSCSTTPRPSSPVALSDAILTLPSQALAGISKTGRLNYIEDQSGDYDEDARRLHLYGDDWRGRWSVDSMLYLRLFEDEKGRTIAASHTAGALYGRPPTDTTHVFRLENGRWIDVSESVLPEGALRSWWYRFDSDGKSIPCGSYVEYVNVSGEPSYRQGDSSGKLLWQDGRFQFEPKG